MTVPPVDEVSTDTMITDGGGAVSVVEGPANWNQATQGELTWEITGMTRKQGKHYTDNQAICGVNWRLLIFPSGNTVQEDFALYLDMPDAKTHGTVKHASFSLTVVNQRDASRSITREANHRFTAEETDWGFTQFMKLRDLKDANAGFIENDTLIVRVSIRITNGVSQWSMMANYDSKKETGYVGLKNQGATCYMNSLLQTLFHTTAFRKAVYDMPTEPPKEKAEPASGAGRKSPLVSQPTTPSNGGVTVPMALQRVFWRLQTSVTSVGTKELTKSFGWDAYDSFTQHDVQELNRVLCDNLEEKMKGTAVDGMIGKLFEGKVLNYVQCINVDFRSQREESFYDLSLNVKGCKDIMESFEKYVEEETLDGDNKYQAEGHGLQDAKKGVKFSKYPPVLHLQLKRFEYDPMRDAMVKVNDRYEFFDEIELDQFLHENAEDRKAGKPQRYILHSVLVHSGDVSGGHYYAFIRPNKRAADQWYKYDDERVTKATPEQAIQDNFGGEEDAPGFQNRRVMTLSKRFSNAYMLVYVRESDYERVCFDLPDNDVPAVLRERLETERQEEEARKKQREEAHLYMNVRVATEEDLRAHEGPDLLDFDKNVAPLRVRKESTVADLRALVSKEKLNGAPEQTFRFWTFVGRQNKTIRPDQPLQRSQDGMTLEALLNKGRESMALAGQLPELRLWVEQWRGAGPAPSHYPWMDLTNPLDEKPAPGERYIFLKFFSPEQQHIEYIGFAAMPRDARVQDLASHVCAFRGLPPSTPLLFYEEVRQSMIEPLEPRKTLADSELDVGDVVICQVDPPPAGAAHRHAPEFYDWMLNRFAVRFFRYEKANAMREAPDFVLELSKKMPYDDVAAAVAAQLGPGTDPLRLRFYGQGYNDQPKTTWVKRQSTMTLSNMLGHAMAALPGRESDVLFFERLDFSIVDLETKRQVKVLLTSHKMEEKVVSVLVPQEANVGDLLAELSVAGAMLPGIDPGHVRVLDVSNGRIHRQYRVDEALPTYHMSEPSMRVEEVPKEEREAMADEKRVTVVHFQRGTGFSLEFHSQPFYMVVRPGETWAHLRSRVQRRLGMSDEDFGRWKFKFVPSGGSAGKEEVLPDDEVVLKKIVDPEREFVGLEHPDTSASARQSRFGYEKPVKIYN
eukprot:tig00021350_g20646.t1